LKNPAFTAIPKMSGMPSACLPAMAVCCLALALLIPWGHAPRAGWKDEPQAATKDTSGELLAASKGDPASDRTPTQVERSANQGVVSNLGLLESLTRSAVSEIADSLRLPPGTPITVVSTTWHEANWFVGNMLARVLADRGYPVRVREVATPPADANGQTPSGAQGTNTPAGQPAQSAPATPPAAQTGAPANTGAETGKALGDTTGAYADSVAKANADPLWGTPEGTTQEAGGSSQTPADIAKETTAHAGAGASRTSLPEGESLDVRVLEFGIDYSDARRVLLLGPVRFTRVGGVYLQVNHLRGPQGDLEKSVMAQRHQVDHLSGSQKALAEGASFPFTPPELKSPSLGRYIEPTVVVAIVSSLVYLFYTNQN
jgi:hypothetical protein